MRFFNIVFIYVLLLSPSFAIAGNEGAHGGDKLHKDFIEGQKLAIKILTDAKLEHFDDSLIIDKSIIEFLKKNREAIIADLSESATVLVSFSKVEDLKKDKAVKDEEKEFLSDLIKKGYTKCGYTENKLKAKMYLFKANCGGYTVEQSARHFLGEVAHHFDKDDVFAAFFANNVLMAYKKDPVSLVYLKEKNYLQEASLGNLEEITALLKENPKFNINVKDSQGNTALILAVSGGHLKLAKFLIEKGVYINSRNKDGQSAFYLSVYLKNYRLVDLLLKNKAEVSTFSPKTGSLFIMLITSELGSKEKDFIKRLLSLSERIPEDSDTSLFMASRYGHKDLVADFLKYDTTIGGRSNAVLEAISYEQYSTIGQIAKFGLHASVAYTALVKCVELDILEPVKAIMDGGADIEYVEKGRDSKRGMRVLNYVRSREAAKLLVETYKAKPDALSSNGSTAFSYIVTPKSYVIPKKDGKLVKYAKELGTSKLVEETVEAIEDMIALEGAVSFLRPSYEAIEYFLSLEIDVNVYGRNRAFIPLIQFARQSIFLDPKVFKKILDITKEPLAVDNNGLTAFDWVSSLKDLYTKTCGGKESYSDKCEKKYDSQLNMLKLRSAIPRSIKKIPAEMLVDHVPHHFTLSLKKNVDKTSDSVVVTDIPYASKKTGEILSLAKTIKSDLDYWCTEAAQYCHD